MFQKQTEKQEKDEKDGEGEEGAAEEAKLPAPKEQAADTSRRPPLGSPGAKAWGSLRRPKRSEGRITLKGTGENKEQQGTKSEQSEVAMGKKEEEKVDQIRHGRQPKFKERETTEGGMPEESSEESIKGAKAGEGHQSGSPIP
jgi:hypothetical protein